MKAAVKLYSILFWVAFLSGLAWIIYIFSKSPGVPVQDEIAHILISRNAWNYPELLLNKWGRPINTLFYMPGSLAGLTGARWFSIIAASLTVILAAKIAQKMGLKSLFLIPVFLWFQPWFNDLSYAAITEVPFSLFLILGVYLGLDKKETLASIPLALLPLVRHEGIALLGIWCFYLLLKRKWRAIIVAVSPMVLYNLIYQIVLNRLPSSIFLSFKPTDFYGSGSWFHFVQPTIRSVGIPICIYSFFSFVPIFRLKEKSLVFIVPYAAYFLIHTAIYRFGLFASGGYQLFLLPLAPAFAISAALGVQSIIEFTVSRLGLSGRGPEILKASVIIICSILVLNLGLRTRPRGLCPEAKAMRQVAQLIRDRGLSENKVVSTHAWFFYFYDLQWKPGELWNKPPALDKLGPGTIVVWDSHYSNRCGLSIDVLSDPANNWKLLAKDNYGTVAIFQKVKE
ncbi:MAG: hypothetical protein JW869_04020 [Candidatus Omnitrophica bacterium]|nr:hypothetical protein [Candidatus Omnitrophota bacterium]